MASKKSYSPSSSDSNQDILKKILKMTAEPILGNSKKKHDSTYSQRSRKVINHDYCDICKGGGEIVCCDKCPRSFHSYCHTPPILLLPAGEWFCRNCIDINKDKACIEVPVNHIGVMGRLQGVFLNKIPSPEVAFTLTEVSAKRKFNAKLQSRKQLDDEKMIRKGERCFICKQGILRGRLVNCHYCSRLYHLNCLEIPVRDWDHSMRWLCPAHDSSFQSSYPHLFTPGAGTLLDFLTTNRQRSELPTLSKNKFFNVPSHIDALYTTPKENIPTMSKNESSLNILCGIATRELESLNSDHSINYENNISAKFLPASQHLSALENNNNLLCKQPYASLPCSTSSTPINISLTCLNSSTPINISIQDKSFTIGKSLINDLCLQYLGNCENVSDYHAIITFNDKLGDFLLKNYSKHVVIVDNVSYSESLQPEDTTSSEMEIINTPANEFMNKRQRINESRNVKNEIVSGSGYTKLKNIVKDLGYDCQVIEYYPSTSNHTVNEIVQCKCNKSLIPKDGYPGDAVLSNGSELFIGCLKFKFTYDICTEVPKCCSEKLIDKQDEIGNKLNGLRLKPQSEQENCINLTKCTRNEHTLVTINRHCSLDDTDDTNSFNEQNNISLFDVDNSQDSSSSEEKTKMNGIPKNIIMHKRNFNPPLDINLSDKLCKRHLNKNNDIVLNECFASDLIQEVDVLSDDGGIIEEEIVYAMHIPGADISTSNRLNDQDWIIEEIVVEEGRNYKNKDLGHSINLQLSSALEYSDHNRGDYKTEHLYCARSPSFNEPIVISDDDE